VVQLGLFHPEYLEDPMGRVLPVGQPGLRRLVRLYHPLGLEYLEDLEYPKYLVPP
jgi:hypothetical protein